MGFTDLFKPKWKHSDPEVRRAAVKEISDQALLADIAKKDKNPNVREEVIKTLTDQAVLAQIAKNDKIFYARYAAVNNPNLVDQIVLAEVAKTDEHETVRLYAVNKITDQAMLAEIAKSNKAWNVRAAAVKKIIDQLVLAEIAQTNIDSDIRKIAVEMLCDKNLREKITEENLKYSARIAEKKEYERQSDLAEQLVSGNAYPDNKSKFYFKGSIHNRDVLKKYAMGCGDFAEIAVENLKTSDQSILYEIAINGESRRVRRNATERLTDSRALAEVATFAKDDHIRELAVKNPKLTDQIILAEVAKTDKNDYIRFSAAKKLSDPSIAQTIFFDIAMIGTGKSQIFTKENEPDDYDYGGGYFAVNHLTDRALLKDVCKNAHDPSVRREAEKRLEKLSHEQ
jgi:hypothetical protein